MSSLAFSEINFKLGLFQDVLGMDLENLCKIDLTVLKMLEAALDTTAFREEYPWDELSNLTELQEFFPEMYQPNESQLWGKLIEKYIIPVARKLTKFVVERHDLMEVRLRRRERQAWADMEKLLRSWDKVPHMPNLFAELTASAA